MPPPLIVSIPHRLGRDEATRRLKSGAIQSDAAIAGHIEAPEVDDDQAPVRRCHR